ncbi:DUF456 domain-containing protein [Bogoriella caseilytica]|uniref:DUF456 family protein n=1 Tax=Bogoriella caseilytica TaxID=56055 RepID=A0A3N2BEE8_9MICO|nr:DUF456 domain-containing protein [Bogoriella caseilytica]ROR73630.1 hypothetical protein EDD31_2017 [Bogoriella caseilytica]
MPWWGELIVGLVVVIGLIGAVIQIYPGSVILLGGILVWCFFTGGSVAWWVGGIATVAVAGAYLWRFLFSWKYLADAGVPNRSMIIGGLASIVGFFVIPVIGLVVGLVAGTYLAERVRLKDHTKAWRATVAALKSTGWSILIELAGALIATGAWITGLILT